MQDETMLSLDRLFNSKEFETKSFGPARWLDDGGYTTLETAVSHPKHKEIIRYDAAGGARTVLVSVDQITPDGAEAPLLVENYHWSDDKKRLLIFTNGQRVWRQNTRGDYWVLALDSGRLTQLGGGAKPSTLMFAKFAPDGRSVAYVREQNIYVEGVGDGRITQLTHDGGGHIINGTSDWVYEEEFHLRDGFRWSPDGTRIAYWQFDTAGIEPFYLINNTDSLYPKLIPLPYPKAGTTNAAGRVGVVGAAGGETTWLDLPGDPRQHYIPKMDWAANSEEIAIQRLNRLQNENQVILGRAADGSARVLLTERSDAWVDVYGDLEWLDDGAAFLWLSDRDGWRRLYRAYREGGPPTPLTPGGFDVIRVVKVEPESGWVYFIASPENPAQRYLYRVDVAGDGRLQRLSPAGQPGAHSYDIAPGARYAFHTYHHFDQPPVFSLVSLPDHKPARLLEGNKPLREKLAALKRQPVEFFRVGIEDGVELDGWLMKPPDFDPTKSYPLLFYVYGEPGSQTVLDVWNGKRTLWHTFLAQQGYLVMSIDNRGTPAPRGKAFHKMVYRQVGILGPDDQAKAAKKAMGERPYIDPDRVGVWGWSGGGSMTLNLMFKYPAIYKTGIAVAAVSDQRYYDTIYQERYMGLPEDNEAGFKNGSPITFADQLEGNLLLIHGTGDDNVHYQAFEAVVNELIKHNKQFAMMAYPNRSHAIKEGENTNRHLYELMYRYLRDNL